MMMLEPFYFGSLKFPHQDIGSLFVFSVWKQVNRVFVFFVFCFFFLLKKEEKDKDKQEKINISK